MNTRTLAAVVLTTLCAYAQSGEPLAGTLPLEIEGDLSTQMVEGIDRWLLAETVRVASKRALDLKTPEALANARTLLAKRLGVVDADAKGGREERLQPSAKLGELTTHIVRWPVFDDVDGQGVLYEPKSNPKGLIVVLNDMGDNEFAPSLAAADFARQGFRVIEPVPVGRGTEMSGSERLGRKTELTHREWIGRQAFEVGRTLPGYEVQIARSAIAAFLPQTKLISEPPVGVAGYGEGALVAKYVATLDPRVKSVLLSGHFGPREGLWTEPLYRNVFGLLRDFGDAELAAMSEAKAYIVEPCDVPVLSPFGKNAAPHKVTTSSVDSVRAEATRAASLGKTPVSVVDAQRQHVGGSSALRLFFAGLDTTLDESPQLNISVTPYGGDSPLLDEHRLVRQLEAHTQRILRESEATRYAQPLWKTLQPGAAWEAAQKQARADFWEKSVGKLSTEYLPPNPRTRQIHDTPKWRGYDVMLDVHPDVFAWGVLIVPKDLAPGERRPVVVCQHGLEGLPEDTITQDETVPAWKSYKGFASRLCERGFIVYVPHNPYRGGDKFRTLQRKANPLGLSLFSFIIAQHDVTTRWLATLPFVDADRIAFYGLSYGGKTAMRVPAVLDRYCLSICSGDFNEWVLKNATTEHNFSYIFTGEYEIFEWDLAHTFNYAEMALLIAPRPFMVERGHLDGVGTSEHIGYEWGKVRRGYDQLGISERAEIEWFNGPHTINGEGTFRFLHKWLRWPK